MNTKDVNRDSPTIIEHIYNTVTLIDKKLDDKVNGQNKQIVKIWSELSGAIKRSNSSFFISIISVILSVIAFLISLAD